MSPSLDYVGQLGPSGLVVLFVLALLTGRLITLRQHEREMTALEKDRDAWKESAKVAERQVSKLLAKGDLGTAVLESIDRVVHQGGDSE